MTADYEIDLGFMPVGISEVSWQMSVRSVAQPGGIVILAPTLEEAMRQAREWIERRAIGAA